MDPSRNQIGGLSGRVGVGVAWAILLSGLLAAAGCSVSSAGGITLFPSGHFLTRTTRQLAEMAPSPALLPRELQKTVVPAYYVEPGDVLLIEPLDFDAPLRLPGDQTVLLDGTIDLGAYGRLVVAGLTVEEIESQVESAMEAVEKTDVKINVRLIEPQGAVYYVLGEVNAPGAYPLIGRETVLDGILNAGGLTNRASSCDIILSRPTPPGSCRVVLPICYRQITQLGDTSTNYQLMPGDRIYVGTRTFWEELMPWRATRDCPRCTGIQCVCLDPSVAQYQNSYAPPLAPTGEPLPSPQPPIVDGAVMRVRDGR